VTDKRKEEHLDTRWRQKKTITELQEKLDIADETISLFQQSVSRLEQFDKKRQNRLEGRIWMVENFLNESKLITEEDQPAEGLY